MQRIPVQHLKDVVTSLLQAQDLPPNAVTALTDSLVGANIRGHDSHGVLRIPQYAEMIEAGAIDPSAEPVLTMSEGATGLVDGRSAFGQLVGRTAVESLQTKAETHGVGVIGIRDGTHLARIGEWAERTTEHDLLFMALVSSQGLSPIVAPAGSAQPRLSTNPICFGVPSFGALEHPIILDMATSQVAYGKIKDRKERGEPLPAGWAISPTGDAVTDPGSLGLIGETGALLPLGGTTSGYKGFGLSVMAALFSSIISNGRIAGEQEAQGWFNNVAVFIALDPTRFTTRERIAERITALAEYIRRTEYSEDIPVGVGATGMETLLPGEAEYQTLLNRSTVGIPVHEKTVESLQSVGETYDVTVEFPNDSP